MMRPVSSECSRRGCCMCSSTVLPLTGRPLHHNSFSRASHRKLVCAHSHPAEKKNRRRFCSSSSPSFHFDGDLIIQRRAHNGSRSVLSCVSPSFSEESSGQTTLSLLLSSRSISAKSQQPERRRRSEAPCDYVRSDAEECQEVMQKDETKQRGRIAEAIYEDTNGQRNRGGASHEEIERGQEKESATPNVSCSSSSSALPPSCSLRSVSSSMSTPLLHSKGQSHQREQCVDKLIQEQAYLIQLVQQIRSLHQTLLRYSYYYENNGRKTEGRTSSFPSSSSSGVCPPSSHSPSVPSSPTPYIHSSGPSASPSHAGLDPSASCPHPCRVSFPSYRHPAPPTSPSGHIMTPSPRLVGESPCQENRFVSSPFLQTIDLQTSSASSSSPVMPFLQTPSLHSHGTASPFLSTSSSWGDGGACSRPSASSASSPLSSRKGNKRSFINRGVSSHLQAGEETRAPPSVHTPGSTTSSRSPPPRRRRAGVGGCLRVSSSFSPVKFCSQTEAHTTVKEVMNTAIREKQGMIGEEETKQEERRGRKGRIPVARSHFEGDSITFESHWSEKGVKDGLEKGMLIIGLLQIAAFQTDRAVVLVNPEHCPDAIRASVPYKEVHLHSPLSPPLLFSKDTRSSTDSDLQSKYFSPQDPSTKTYLQFSLGGFVARNRALHGDLVAVTFFPRFYSEHLLSLRGVLTSPSPSSLSSPTTTTTIPTSSSSCCLSSVSSARSSPPSLSLHNSDSSSSSPCPGSTTSLTPHSFSDTEDACLPSSFSVSKADGTVGQVGRIGQTEGEREEPKSEDPSSRQVLKESSLQTAHGCEEQQHSSRENNTQKTAGDSKEPVKCGKDQQKKLEYLSTGRVVRILARSRDTSRLVCVIPPQYDTLRKFLSSRSLVASTPTSGGMTGVEGYDAAKHGDKHGQEKEEKGRNVGRRKERTMRENHRSTMKSQDNRDVASCSSNVDAGGERGGNGDRYTGNLYLKAQPRDSRLPPFLIPVASLFESLPSDKQFNPGPDAFSLLASHDSRSSDRCSSSLPPPFSSSSSSLPCSSSVSLPSLKDERGSMKSRLHPTPLLRSILTVWAGSQESEKDNSSVPDRYSDATISPSLSPSPASPTSSPFSSPSASSSSCSPSSFSSSSLSSALVVIGRGGWGSRYACPLGVIDETSRCLGGKGEEDILGEALSTLHMQGLIHAEGFPQEILQNLEERLSKSTGSKTSGRKPLWLVEAENDNYRLDCRPHLRIDDSQRGLEMKGDNNTQVECRSRSSRTNLVSNRNLEMSEDVSGGEKEVKIRRKDILCKGEETQRIEEQVERRAEKRSASTQIDSLDERRKTEKKEEQARGYLPDKNEEEQSPSEQHHDRLQPSCLRASSSLEGSPLSSFPSLNISFYASSPPSSLSSSVRPVEYSTSSLRAFTIDPPTAKDLDDAISIVLRKGLSSCPSSASSKNGCEASTYGREDLSDSCYLQALQGSETNREQTDGEKEEKRHKEQTTFEIGVHVADVSHFVQEGSDLDAAAAERATTVYLDAKVFPMLPSPLSEGVCSLLPNEDRLAFSMFMALDENGELLSRPSPLLVKTLIKTECRLDYSQVDAFLGTLRRSLAKAPCLCTSPAPRHLRYSTSSLSIREDRQKSVGDLRKLHSASPEYFSLENPLLWNLLISHAPPFSYSRNPYRSSPTCHPSFIGDKECGRALNSLEKNSHEEDRCRETEIVVKEDEKWLVKNTEEWRQRKSDLSGVLQSTAQDFGIPCEISRDILILHLLTSRRKALRREQGALHLSSAGKLSMYIEPHPVHLKPKRLHIIEENHSLSHALVEECMILANHCVAREILSAGTRALGRQQHARRGGTHGLHEESSRDTRLKERENRQHAEIQEQQWRYTRDDQTSPFSFTERTEGNGLSAKKDEKSKEQSQVVLSSDVSFDVKSKSNDEEEEDRNRSRRSLRMSRKTDDPDGQGRREEDKEEQERKKGREVGSRTLNEEEGRTGGTSENLPLLSPQQESVFGGLLRQHSNSNFEAVKYLRSLMGASLWSEFCREEKNKLVSRTCTDACTEEEQEKQKEEKDEEQREDDQQDLKGVLLGHVLEFCSSRMDAPVYNALCFSVLQEYFSQAQYVSPMMSLKSASPSSSEQPSSLSSKEKRVRTDRREEPSSSSATTTTSLYLSRNVAHESDAASGKGGIVEMAQDEKDYGTKATQHSHARDDFLSSFSHPPDQKHHHNGSNAPIPLDSQFSHWALNLSSYMHFTSPIRRYADLHIHRILSKYLRGDDLTVPIDTLQRACKQCNENSRKADEAQMTFRSWYFNAYLRRHQPEGLLYSHATILKIILPSHFSKSKENADDGVEHLQQQPTSQGVPIAATSILHQVETQETVTPLSTPIEGRGTENMDEDQHFNKIDCDKRLGDVLRTKETLHNHGDDDKKENKLKLEERAVDTDGGEEEKTTSKEGKNAAAVNSEKNKAALVIYIPLLQSTRSMSLATLGLEHVDDVDEVCEDTREKKQGWVRQEERENNPKADNKNRGCNEVTSIHVRRLVLPLASSLPSPSHPLVDSTIPTTPSPPSLSYSSSHPPVTVFSSLSSSPAPPSSPSCSCSSSSTSMSAESKSLLQGSFSREVWREEETRKLRVLQRIQVLIVPGESQWTVRLPFWKRVEEETAEGEKDDIQDISSDDRTCGRTQ